MSFFNLKKCEECGNSFHYQSGYFTLHLKNEHNMALRDYVVKWEYNNEESQIPKCQCGYCNEQVPFSRGKFLVGHKYRNHENHKWKREQYIKLYGVPKCKTCEKEIGFNRDKPLKYCSHKCMPNNWNQNTIEQNNFKKYGVTNVSYLKEIKEKIGDKNKLSSKEALIKRRETVKKLYGEDCVAKIEIFKLKMKETLFKKYGVYHISHTEKFKKASSERMIKNNPSKDKIIKQKSTDTYIERLKNGNYTVKTYKYKDTKLTYQSSYEYEFLELCENLNILDRINNGNVYIYIYNMQKHKMLTDFSIEDYEIEIKSSWIMKKQGGIDKVIAKRDSVEKLGKKYIFILDKDYTNFIKLFN
jgi:hypothetical protein